ncbi:MAG: hypothetical protein M3R52_12805, partial [Acidobacteriota bacterium]|nr:hypothetical protein [Acidobacteriota bacterium]
MKAHQNVEMIAESQIACATRGLFRKAFNSLCSYALVACLLGAVSFVQPSVAQTPQYPNLPSEMPAKFK